LSIEEMLSLLFLVVAFLIRRRIATTQRCHLWYQRRNGEKGPRLFIFHFNCWFKCIEVSFFYFIFFWLL